MVINQMVGGQSIGPMHNTKEVYTTCTARRKGLPTRDLHCRWVRQKASPSLDGGIHSVGCLKEGAWDVKRNRYKTMLHVIDDMTCQKYNRKFCQMRNLSHDAKIERLAWLVVLGWFITAILETRYFYQVLF